MELYRRLAQLTFYTRFCDFWHKIYAPTDEVVKMRARQKLRVLVKEFGFGIKNMVIKTALFSTMVYLL